MNGVPFAGRVDPRERRYIRPTRILWQSGAIQNAEALLADGDAVAALHPGTDAEPTAIVLDFGTELHGGIRIDAPRIEPKGSARFRVRFGESASEAMGAPDNDHALHDTVVDVPWMGHAEIGNTGFRFVRLDLLDTQATVELREVLAVAILRPLDYLGSFECSDPLLNRIWQVGATTVHLCMQDHVWDGIKRDRLVWIGDLHPEQRVV
ncbi:alpha-L-rhamnosidase, partial [bacterium]|nr:alpha-L-rhamnosidase [bacterium]